MGRHPWPFEAFFSELWSILNNVPSRAEIFYIKTALEHGGAAFDIGANVGRF
jgi:hypothetical protein